MRTPRVTWAHWDRNHEDGEARSYTCEGTPATGGALVHLDEDATPNTWVVTVYYGTDPGANDRIVAFGKVSGRTARDAQRAARQYAVGALSTVTNR